MADDILGHDHLDHGKHLHKHHEDKQRHRDSRLPSHIGLGEKNEERTPWQCSGKTATIITGVSIVLAVILYQSFTALAILIAVIIINTALEFHKRFTRAAPVDIEIVSLGTAYLSATHGFWWAAILAVIGPIIAHLFLGYFGDATIIKVVSLVIIAAAATALGQAPIALFIAILFGLLFQLFAFAFVLGHDVLLNVISRITTGAFIAYILFVVLPAFQ